MKPSIIATIAAGSLALCAALASSPVKAQTGREPYPSMAPVEQYLIADRDAEIALARSAAPESISRDAEVMVLGRRGYETAVKGRNGFVCVVQRSWTAGPEDTDFWNPKLNPKLRADLLQCGGGAYILAAHDPKNRTGTGGKDESTDVSGD
jgi:hypothetical protein